MKGQKTGKSQFVTKFIELKLQLFSYKNFLQIVRQIFAEQFSFTDHLKQNIVIKVTCRMPSSNSYQL